MNGFRVGPAVLRNGDDAFIFELGDACIFGKRWASDEWLAMQWTPYGTAYIDPGSKSALDLVPNEERDIE